MALLGVAQRVLPRGGTLSGAAWRRRHRALLIVLWVHVPLLFVYGSLRGKGALHSLQESLLIAGIAIAATQLRGRSRVVQSSLVALGLMASAALVVHFSDGAIEAHFHFFVFIILLTLYQDWVPFLLSIAFVALHHGVMGTLDPTAVYNHTDAQQHPWLWGAIHAAYVLAASIAGVASWRLSEADQQARLDQIKREKLRELTLLQEAAHLLSSTVDRQDILASAARLGALIASSTDVQRRAAVCGVDGATASVMAEYGESGPAFPGAGILLPAPRALIDAVRTGTLRTLNLADPTTGDDDRAAANTAGWRCAAFAPVTVQGSRIGAIAVSGGDERGFGEAEASALEAIAELTGLALSKVASEDALRESERKFRGLFEHNPQPMFVYDRSRLTFMTANHAAVSHYGYSRAELNGLGLGEIGSFGPGGEHAGDWQHPPEGRHEAQHRLKDGRVVHVQVHTRHQEFDGQNAGLAVIVDVTEQRALENQLRHQALHDPLTSLANRVLFGDRVDHARARGGRQHTSFAVLLLDLDNFKQVNDSLGHAAGDDLIVAVAARIVSCLRPGDTAARLGGDEFAVLLEDLSEPADAEHIAQRVLEALREPFTVDGREIFIGASVGVAQSGCGEASADRLLRDADLAMYSAKERGKGCHVVFDRRMHDAVLDRAALEHDLHGVVERGELRLVYQPQIDMRSGRIVGVEALVRWDHPVRGPIGPDRFIPIAEESGLIGEVDAWVLDAASAQTRAWLDAGLPAMRVSINASGRQFDDGTLVQRVSECLRRYRLPRGVIEIELTERVAVQHERAAETVAQLQAMGVGVAIDDFGTGYSMLATLRHFPGDKLKIDKGFIDEIDANGDRAALVGAIIAMGHGLGLQVVAEGVETAEQVAFLRHHGCDESQGYFFSRPVDPLTIERELRRSRAASAFEKLMGADDSELDELSALVSAEPDLERLARSLLAELGRLGGLDSTYLIRRGHEAGTAEVQYAHNATSIVVPEGRVLPAPGDADGDYRPMSGSVPFTLETTVPVVTADGAVVGWLGAGSARETGRAESVLTVMELFARLLGAHIGYEQAGGAEEAGVASSPGAFDPAGHRS